MALPWRYKLASAAIERSTRSGATAGFQFESFGMRIGIQTNEVRLISGIEALIPPGAELLNTGPLDRFYVLDAIRKDGADGRSLYRINVGRKILFEGGDLQEGLETLESDMQLFVAEWARGKVFVHAGVVGYRGEAIVIPGCSFSGKTTLVSALVQRGAIYYSDEYAVLDSHGLVHPYARALRVRMNETLRARISPEALNGTVGAGPLPIGKIIIGSYRPRTIWKPIPQSAGQGVLAMFANSVAARTRPKKVFAALDAAVSGALILKGDRGEAAESACQLLGLL